MDDVGNSGSALTSVLAWTGALTGSAALLWDVYKWRHSGPKLRIQIQPNTIPQLPGVATISHYLNLMVTVSNSGQKRTTITQLNLAYYPTLWKRLRQRPT